MAKIIVKHKVIAVSLVVIIIILYFNPFRYSELSIVIKMTAPTELEFLEITQRTVRTNISLEIQDEDVKDILKNILFNINIRPFIFDPYQIRVPTGFWYCFEFRTNDGYYHRVELMASQALSVNGRLYKIKHSDSNTMDTVHDIFTELYLN